MIRNIRFFCIASYAASLHSSEQILAKQSLQELSQQYEQKLIAVGLPKPIAQIIVNLEKKEAHYNNFGQEEITHFDQLTTKAISHFQNTQEKHQIVLEPYLLKAYKWQDDDAIKKLRVFGVEKRD